MHMTLSMVERGTHRSLEEADILDELGQFEAVFQIDLSSKDDVLRWKENFEKTSKTTSCQEKQYLHSLQKFSTG